MNYITGRVLLITICLAFIALVSIKISPWCLLLLLNMTYHLTENEKSK